MALTRVGFLGVGPAWPGFVAKDATVIVSFDLACERTLANLTPVRRLASLTVARALRNTTPRRTLDCLED